ncbi:GNAT family N-acetyltransferase [Actinacidiphila bryophytorum]|uniref:Predicted acetyltransferase, GNAT family n=1 Tax=Actinacidiphila bryophytorum TaxID=1436133 RepID=A0A9W4E6F1_9ACTN|nr:GNAT family N-acetyltransferase [Actinacidiphila bryophytorum]MBM9439141.1 GNAT family N-acetyltransferase [Actinacidiphila bryophytorum]MBN6544838.1 GNAT family N-acetyltransferase [Actinacidiphila bryophytorum]CAG7621933.1 Predicted acetyltransferase, GNAT family [Actinacidiphila bryophytorum]
MSTRLDPSHPSPPRESAEPHVLDNAAWAALNGPHRHLAQTVGSAARYRTDVSPFVAVADPGQPQSWADLADLVGAGNSFAIAGVQTLPDGWDTGQSGQGVQMVATAVEARTDPEAERLGPSDVPEMLALVERAKPGPFLPGTVEMGAYYGIRRGGRLVAMAGERLRPPGWTEISAVCTDDEHRGQGLASRLVLHTAAGIGARGDTPFLHAAAVNTGAIRLYESLGFTLRRSTLFHFLQVPGDR